MSERKFPSMTLPNMVFPDGVLPLTKSYRIGIIKEKLSEPIDVVVPTPYGEYKQKHYYIIKKTIPVDQKMRTYKIDKMVILFLYGLIQIPLKTYYSDSKNTIVLEMDGKDFFFKKGILYKTVEKTRRGIDMVTTTERFYNFGNIDILKGKFENESNIFGVVFPPTKLKDYIVPRRDPIYLYETVYSRTIEDGTEEEGEYTKTTVFFMDGFTIAKIDLYEDHKLIDTEKVINPIGRHQFYNYENTYDMLKTIRPSLELPMSRKMMKKLLTQLDTDISKPSGDQRQKMGGPLMDPNLIKVIGSYVDDKDYY